MIEEGNLRDLTINTIKEINDLKLVSEEYEQKFQDVYRNIKHSSLELQIVHVLSYIVEIDSEREKRKKNILNNELMNFEEKKECFFFLDILHRNLKNKINICWDIIKRKMNLQDISHQVHISESVFLKTDELFMITPLFFEFNTWCKIVSYELSLPQNKDRVVLVKEKMIAILNELAYRIGHDSIPLINPEPISLEIDSSFLKPTNNTLKRNENINPKSGFTFKNKLMFSQIDSNLATLKMDITKLYSNNFNLSNFKTPIINYIDFLKNINTETLENKAFGTYLKKEIEKQKLLDTEDLSKKLILEDEINQSHLLRILEELQKEFNYKNFDSKDFVAYYVKSETINLNDVSPSKAIIDNQKYFSKEHKEDIIILIKALEKKRLLKQNSKTKLTEIMQRFYNLETGLSETTIYNITKKEIDEKLLLTIKKLRDFYLVN